MLTAYHPIIGRIAYTFDAKGCMNHYRKVTYNTHYRGKLICSSVVYVAERNVGYLFECWSYDKDYVYEIKKVEKI